MASNQIHRVPVSVRVPGDRRAQTFSGIDAAARALGIVSGPSVLKRIRMGIQEAQVVVAEFDGKEYTFFLAH